MSGISAVPHQIRVRTQKHNRLHVVHLATPWVERFYVTDAPGDEGSPESLAEDVGEFLESTGSRVAAMNLFGPCSMRAPMLKLLQRYCGEVDWPFTWVDGSACVEHAPVATQFYAVRGPMEPLFHLGHRVGSVIEDVDGRWVIIVGLEPTAEGSRAEQARSLFERMDHALRPLGMDFHNIVRTWLYCDRILEWYDELNQVRNAFFSERGVYDRLVPASTGVGTSNPSGKAIIGEALAFQPRHEGVTIRSLPSPLQCPAPAYGSSFSRAVEIRLPGYDRLYISGTASINLDGTTAHVGDVEAQVALTMRVVRAILDSAGYTWADINRAIAYFKRPQDAGAWESWCKRSNVMDLPLVVVQADICRDDLLFEIELDALRASV
jgi:enamine deaminase RidA (YjgF/YER057c/UK114 family)